MKKNLWIAIGSVVIGLSLNSFALADDAMAPAMSSTKAMSSGKHACRNIAMACKAAGFTREGAKQNKGIGRNCMKPILAGQSVSGVTVDANDVAACQARISKRMQNK